MEGKHSSWYPDSMLHRTRAEIPRLHRVSPADRCSLLFGLGSSWLFLLVQQVQILAGLEANGLAWSNRDFRPGARIAPDTGLARAHVEHAKAAQFDSVASCERFLQALKHRVDCDLRLVPRQPGPFDYVMDYVLFNQRIRLGSELVAQQPSTCAMLGEFARIVNAAGLS
jgi:hypothetical protein